MPEVARFRMAHIVRFTIFTYVLDEYGCVFRGLWLG